MDSFSAQVSDFLCLHRFKKWLHIFLKSLQLHSQDLVSFAKNIQH